MSHISLTADDLAGVAWYNTATEETRKFWHAIAGSSAPVDAWIAYRDTAGTLCPPLALNGSGDSQATLEFQL